MSKEATMPQQPVTLELTATISDKTFPIGSFTINIPINVTHNELITRFTNAIKAFKTTFETNPDEVGAVKS